MNAALNAEGRRIRISAKIMTGFSVLLSDASRVTIVADIEHT